MRTETKSVYFIEINKVHKIRKRYEIKMVKRVSL